MSDQVDDDQSDTSDPRELTMRLFEALGITRVINVDDDHAADQLPSLEDVVGALRAESIDRRLAARLVLPDGQDDHAELMTTEELIELVEEEWEQISDERRVELTQAAERASAADEGPVETQSQEVLGDNAALLALPELLGEAVQFIKMGLREWRESGQSLLEDGQLTLLLFDRSFEREGLSPTAGEELVKGILRRDDLGHVHVGLLTHTAADHGRERELAAEIEAELSVQRPVVVVAKQRLSTGSFPEALRLILFADELETLRSQALKALDAAGRGAADFVRGVDRYVLLASVEAARQEGAFETDHTMRMANSSARKILAEVLREEPFVDGPLTKLRNATAVQLYFDGAEKPGALPQIEWDERFDSGDHLASLAIPLEIGDIFRVFDLLNSGKSKGAERYYILLAQACDLSVRANGKRSNSIDSLVLTELRSAPLDPGTGKPRAAKENEADLGRLFPERPDFWRVHLARQILVPTLALDACVVNASGRSILGKDQVRPKSLPASWNRRLDHMIGETEKIIRKYEPMDGAFSESGGNSIASRTAKEHITAALLASKPQHSAGITGRINVTSSTIEYGITRHASVSESMARGLLALLSHHHARPAFDGHLFYDPSP